MKTTLFVFFVFFFLFLNNNLFSQNITAKYNKHVVDSLMNTINPNAKLRRIISDSVLINGFSLSWSYEYGCFSGDTHTNYFIHATSDSVVYDSLNHLAPLGTMYIDTCWIDSDSAFALAESQGGRDFRKNHTNFMIVASLGKPLVPNSTNRWYIHYISLNKPSADILFINLDATDYLTNVLESTDIPNDLILYQNYPNPFNPNTTIRFTIKHTGYVKLKVYDLIGKEIKTLLNGNKSPGNYIVQFDGSELSSGIYIYKLEFDSFTKAKKFVLLK